MPLREQVAAMALDLINNSNHWHNRAQEMRTFAEDITNPDARTIMLRVAVDYDRLARLAEEAPPIDETKQSAPPD
jgi:hypothetical protein